MASVLKVDKLDPQSGTALEIGTSGDTVSIPSGATLDISASTLTPPATMPASSGVNLTALNATQLTSGTVPAARLSGVGKILQVVETSDVITLISTTSTTYVTNGIELDITPSATSSKILLLYQHVCYVANVASDHMGMTIFRDSTDLAGDEGLIINQVGSAWMPVSMTYLDSPSSTSSLNYEIFFKTSSPLCYGGYADWRPASFVALEIGA